jgi:hypothetical protein
MTADMRVEGPSISCAKAASSSASQSDSRILMVAQSDSTAFLIRFNLAFDRHRRVQRMTIHAPTRN